MNTLSFSFNNFIGIYRPKEVGHERDSRSHARCHNYSKTIAHASSPWLYSCFTWPHTVPSMIPTFSTTLTLFPKVIISLIPRNRGRDRRIMSAISAVTLAYFFARGYNCFKVLIFPNCFCFKIFLILYYSVINKEKVI